jgi:hypothetical protein
MHAISDEVAVKIKSEMREEKLKLINEKKVICGHFR